MEEGNRVGKGTDTSGEAVVAAAAAVGGTGGEPGEY